MQQPIFQHHDKEDETWSGNPQFRTQNAHWPSRIVLSPANMAKVKSMNVPNKSLHSRVSFLYQAATYFATHEPQPQRQQQHANPDLENQQSPRTDTVSPDTSAEVCRTASRHLASDLRSVSLKMQIRMSPEMKHSMCNNCNTMLVVGSTCSERIENHSRGRRKPWADVLVRGCRICGIEKRFPVGARRQKRRPHRAAQDRPPSEQE